ncbi:MAG TPA: MerR family transcriptional regulator [Candidatus Pelethocola excrementipullorum]|nr:MerR family transcriptional regulator [Candidatus Pelethocola excrementipullorum]
MYTIGQTSEMFHLPASTLRYYDKEGLFPNLQRSSGVRRFSDNEIEALRVIECLKKSGLAIKDIKKFMEWSTQGSQTFKQRKELFEEQKSAVENEIDKLERVLDMLKYKCWYYEEAIKDGNEDRLSTMLPDQLPKNIRVCYDNSHYNSEY